MPIITTKNWLLLKAMINQDTLDTTFPTHAVGTKDFYGDYRLGSGFSFAE